MLPVKRKIRVPKNCQFCKERVRLHFTEVATLSRYISDRGRIIGRDRSGVCAKHQRGLSIAVKRARHLALLPFVSGL
ncbi:30S ribosomal protein S18 [Candidatus Amesbacteria bacterium RIFCSPLOWO2_02_FULL_48_11]|uniref:Small ribosomal subunit protein bS18 n=4 Tax=Candidatus Amesiibacteriota TaxID=1752730 RepID=A0A1F4Z7T7_9BACT|nr:MAG: 30S ribosomal protein S18 [Candidatus Amesbacteria bacterium GW2011_GWA2_47_11]KKW00025.1 MAG: 30S ribosomal protein S18 [Candidatus Amesbacteria bacterium GW2011_GWA1_48_9]OGC90643.1 MAG: 30S ribosomal protein S18 [Candidatus Amesbacteria bacterium RBG_19FT_COMBO_48_16]OGC99220.1 MAG: 30S ribosomal protein S18 [Candidatus Amesbacteria bacterium RBG_16_48_31]OGC99303.1 MAG: 30S ribosomal protein S18 [Candidatus Amesbacteria bacterium RIFCSPHIGHO2_01_FULL_48_75]OGD01751.1 MAG: 30S ribos